MSDSHNDVSLVDRLVSEGLDDWLDPGWMASESRFSGAITWDDFRSMVIGTAAHMIFSGLAVAGEVRDGSFHAWPDGRAESVIRIVDALGPLPVSEWRPGDAFWLKTTDAGDERGRRADAAMDFHAVDEHFAERPVAEAPGLLWEVMRAAGPRGAVHARSIVDLTSTTDVSQSEDRMCLALGVTVRLVFGNGAAPGTVAGDGTFRAWADGPVETLPLMYALLCDPNYGDGLWLRLRGVPGVASDLR